VPALYMDSAIGGILERFGRIQNHSESGTNACVKLPEIFRSFRYCRTGSMLWSRLRRNPIFFTTTEPRFDFHDPLGGKIAKYIFDIPRITHAAGKWKTRDRRAILSCCFILVESGMDFRQEESVRLRWRQGRMDAWTIGRRRSVGEIMSDMSAPPGGCTRLGRTHSIGQEFFIL